MGGGSALLVIDLPMLTERVHQLMDMPRLLSCSRSTCTQPVSRPEMKLKASAELRMRCTCRSDVKSGKLAIVDNHVNVIDFRTQLWILHEITNEATVTAERMFLVWILVVSIHCEMESKRSCDQDLENDIIYPNGTKFLRRFICSM